ncbi:MAG: chitin disaccharide deacetylase [Thomasclavelia sp.]|nr:chitin disaccharide deacetylase [Thomasclavelia sp.]
MIKNLIVNCDDFGISEGVNLAVNKAFNDGVLRSTTLMANMEYIEDAAIIANRNPDLGVGVHLTLSAGKPLTKKDTDYVDERGYFKKIGYYRDGGKVDLDDLYHEWKAQIEKYIEVMGHYPDHLDSHHHAQNLPGVQDVFKRLAKEYDLPVRNNLHLNDDYPTFTFTTEFYGNDASVDKIIELCTRNEGTLEIMCHVGYVDEYIMEHSSYNIQRAKELAIMCNPRLLDFIKENNIKLINYQSIEKK